MQASPLDALHDVLPPSEVSWWPLSPMLWVLLITTLLLLFIVSRYIYKAHCHKKAKKQAILHSQQCTHDAQALHIILKRLTKHYYGVAATTQSQTQWANTLSRLSGQSFNAQELNSLYSPSPDSQLASKLVIAISQFKLKEALDV
jgi:hypothetical protein